LAPSFWGIAQLGGIIRFDDGGRGGLLPGVEGSDIKNTLKD